MLQKILRQSVSTAPIATGNLLIAGDEAIKWLRAANEQKLLQKMAKSTPLSVAPTLEEFSFLANAAQHNLAVVHDIKFVTGLAQEFSSLSIPSLGSMAQEARGASHALRMSAEFRQLKQLKRTPISFETPEWKILKSEGKKIGNSLRKANDFLFMDIMNKRKEQLTLPNIARFATRARFTTKRLQAAHEARIMNKIFKSERNRGKIIKDCIFHAKWAGSHLRRWNRVWTEYEKSTKKLKIMDSLINEAHSQFLMIMTETGNIAEIEKRCEGNPFLLREFKILHNEVEKYYKEKRDKEENEILSPPSFHL